jgi:hypothetical protein
MVFCSSDVNARQGKDGDFNMKINPTSNQRSGLRREGGGNDVGRMSVFADSGEKINNLVFETQTDFRFRRCISENL